MPAAGPAADINLQKEENAMKSLDPPDTAPAAGERPRRREGSGGAHWQTIGNGGAQSYGDYSAMCARSARLLIIWQTAGNGGAQS